MNIDMLKASGIDYEDGLERFSGNSQLYEKYLTKFLDNHTYEEMRDAACGNDLRQAFELAHKLKAFLGNLSMSHFYEEIRSLTEEFRAGVRRDYKPDFAALDPEYRKIKQAIRGNQDVQ